MKAIVSLRTVVKKDIDEQAGGTIRLQQVALSCNGRDYEESSFKSDDVRRIGVSQRNRHRLGLKPGPF
jgi:hypothetical protein